MLTGTDNNDLLLLHVSNRKFRTYSRENFYIESKWYFKVKYGIRRKTVYTISTPLLFNLYTQQNKSSGVAGIGVRVYHLELTRQLKEDDLAVVKNYHVYRSKS